MHFVPPSAHTVDAADKFPPTEQPDMAAPAPVTTVYVCKFPSCSRSYVSTDGAPPAAALPAALPCANLWWPGTR